MAVGGVREMGKLVKEIVAVFASVDRHIKVGLDGRKNRAIVPGQQIVCDNKGDLIKLRGSSSACRKRNSGSWKPIPRGLHSRAFDDDLAERGRLLEHGTEAEARSFIKHIVQIYQDNIKTIGMGLGGYGDGCKGAPYQKDLGYIKDQLRRYRVKLAADFAKGPQNSISVHASAVNQNSNENVLTVTQTAEQIQAIPESVLSEDLKSELKLLLLDIDSARGKSKKDAEGKLKKVLDWLADKGVDVALAALPYVLNVLQTLA